MERHGATGRGEWRSAMDDAALGRLEHENMVTAFGAILSGVPGSLVRDEGGVAIVASGLPVSWFNQLLVGAPDASDEALTAAVAVMRERGASWLVHLREGIDARLEAVLAALGLVAGDDDATMPGMALHPIPTDAPAATHDIRRIRDAAGLADHVAVAAAGFGMPAELAAQFMTPGLATTDGVSLYVGYLEGRPITAGAGVRTGRTIGVYNIATMPDARRRGYGAEITARVAADGLAAGCDTAILQASAMGQPIYERMGYRTVVRYRAWTEPS
jgi:GNAT superfamily N-acetyltransferase